MTKNIENMRRNCNMTQQQVANNLGITRQTYSHIEKGEKDLTLGQAVKIKEMFNIDIDDLLPSDIELIENIEFDREKYIQIIKNFIHFGSSDGKIQKTKLAKLCYLLDFSRYYYNLESITGLQYRRIQQGPVPDLYFTTLEVLEEKSSIKIEKKSKAYMISNISFPTFDRLSEDEMNLLKNIAKKWENKDTQTIVDFTHKQMPWMMCHEKEIIPYSLITQEDPSNVY